VVLGAVDRRIGLIDRLTAAITDTRDARYITHTLHDFLAQRVFQIASGYEGANDANTLRSDPMFKLAANKVSGSRQPAGLWCDYKPGLQCGGVTALGLGGKFAHPHVVKKALTQRTESRYC
jgi:hypothetical protein